MMQREATATRTRAVEFEMTDWRVLTRTDLHLL